MASNTRILIGDEEWSPMTGGSYDPDGLVYTGPPFSINGVPMHLTAYPVVVRPTVDDGEVYGIQEGAEGFEDEFNALSTIDPDGAFETVRIKGQDYVLILTPFQSY